MTVAARVTLGAFLTRHGLTASRVVIAGKGRLSRGAVYALARGTVARVDLGTLAKLAEVLEELTGQPVAVGDLLALDAQADAARASGPLPRRVHRHKALRPRPTPPLPPEKRNGRNPCRTQPGEQRKVQHQDLYTSAAAASFANVPNATVYHALREGRLHRKGDFIRHADLLRWMQARGFPVPEDLPVSPGLKRRLTLREASVEAGVSEAHLKLAIRGGRLNAHAPGTPSRWRIDNADLNAWIRGGRKVPEPNPRKLLPREVQVMEALELGDELLFRRRGWTLNGKHFSSRAPETLRGEKLIKERRNGQHQLTELGLDALAAHRTGRATPTPDEAALIREATTGYGLVRLVRDDQMTPEQASAEQECLTRGWMTVTPDRRLLATYVGWKAVDRLPIEK